MFNYGMKVGMVEVVKCLEIIEGYRLGLGLGLVGR